MSVSGNRDDTTPVRTHIMKFADKAVIGGLFG